MSEFTVNERRNWKAQVFPYDHFIPDESQECLYCLTDKQAEILRGIIEPLGWKTRWWSDDDTPIDKNEIEAFRDDLIRRLMMSCCGDEVPVRYRYTDGGVLQRSEDGGSTWTDAPDYDPRNYSPQFPPMSGTDGPDKRCLAATGAADLIKQQVGDQLTDDMSRYTLSQLITDWLKTYIETSNPLQALLTVIANQIFALVIAVLRPALTDTVYSTLKCILYCHIGNDASFNDAQWQAVRDDITSQIGGIAGVFLEHLVYLLGAGGLTNVARAGGASSGDCSACDCHICGDKYKIGYNYSGSYSALGTLIDSGVNSSGNWFMTVGSFDRGDGKQAVAITLPNTANVAYVTWTESTPPGYVQAKSATGDTEVPTYENLHLNPLLTAGVYTSLYFLSDSSSAWQITFEFYCP